jgi:UDP-N-acetyl-2-amino-2-deoxyglucuronate dehydrogenase
MDDNMNRIKCALLGCGRIASKHLQALQDNGDDFELIAVCDAVEAQAQATAVAQNVPYYLDLEAMLKAAPAIDLLCICTPSGLHPEQAILAAQYGKHVVTEKPMACTVADAKQMIAVAKQNNTRLFVVKQNRLNPTVQALKQAVDQGRFGKIYMVQSNVFWTRPQEYYSQAPWRGTWKMDGGAFMNQASHYVDLLEWLVGPVKTVQAMTRTLARNIEAEDSGVVNLAWENGAIGSMSVTMLTYPKNMEGSITILGEKGTVRLDGVALNEVKIWDFADNQDEDIASLSYQPDTVYGNGHGPYYKNIADVLQAGAAPIADGVSGLKSVQLLSAIYTSAKTGRVVELGESEAIIS